MSPTIRIDDEVYDWLRGQAVPFEDTPNSVLRRMAGLDGSPDEDLAGRSAESRPRRARGRRSAGRRRPLATGDELIHKWAIPAVQARFHVDGHYYQHLTKFPGALCDPRGYVIFEDKEAYRRCQQLRLGQQLNVESPGISSIPGYQEVDDPLI